MLNNNIVDFVPLDSFSESYKELEKNKKNPIINPKKYVEYLDNKFYQKLGQYTFGLDKVIPWEDSNFIFSGGLLYDILTNKFDKELMDIDLFFYGDYKEKHKTINKLLDNLDKEQYYYLIGYKSSVIYIFIQGIPRIIQLIMTNKTEPEQIINSFDLTHVMSYSDGNKIYSNLETIEQIKNKNTSINIIHKNRLIKYFEKGLDIEKIIYSDYNFILDSIESKKIVNTQKQKNLYKFTNNLTTEYLNPSVTLDFCKITKEQINFHDYFECKVNYDKFNNHEFKENVNMFGAFVDYLGLKPKSILNMSTEINENISNTNFEKIKLINYKTSDYGLKYQIKNNNSLYAPCKFIRYNLFEKETEQGQKNINVVEIYFQITNENIIEYLTKKINKQIILDNLNFQCFYLGTVENYKLNEIKNNLDESLVYYPICKNIEFDGYDGIVICAKLYGDDNIDKFKKINEKNIFEKLEYEKDNQIYCLFDLNIYVRKPQNSIEIKYIDINLSPIYIGKK